MEGGIHKLAIPTPFAVGRVNLYLIDDDPLTLVDAGPNSGRSLDELEGQLRGLGRRVEDIGLILVTHQHIDHIGLVGIVARRSGAEVAAIDKLVPFMENYSEHAAVQDTFASQLMLRHGIAPDVVQALQSVSLAYRAWGARADVSRVLHDGDVVELRDRRLEVHFRPGHSPTDTVFYDPESRRLLAADHLLAHISSNPLMTPAEEGEERPQALVAYLDSLSKTRAMDLAEVLPGHGDPITDHRNLIDQRVRLHRKRADKILDQIRERSRTAHDLAQALWGNVAVTQAFLTLSEVIGHTDILMNEGKVREVEEGGVVRFEAT
ncbi:MAG: MBL fold metallo-hydrolase [Actinomycetota bacterium]|nr:MBL fold metallo-hydrolase [Actinomycetota bacterium]